MTNFDETLIMFRKHYKNLYILLFFSCSFTFLSFYSNRYFEIPYKLKGLLFGISLMSIFFYLFSKTGKLSFALNQEMFLYKQRQNAKKDSKQNKFLNIFLIILPIIVMASVYMFVNLLNIQMLVLLLLLLLIGVVSAYLIYLLKHYISLKRNNQINMFHGIIPDILIATLFLFVLPSLIYPVIAVKRHHYKHTSYLDIEKETAKLIGTQNSVKEKEFINKLLKKYNCRECGKNYGATVTIRQCPDGCMRIKIISEYTTAYPPSKSHDRVVKSIVKDIERDKTYIIKRDKYTKSDVQKTSVKQTRVPGGIPSMFTYIMLLGVLLFKNMDSKLLMDYKNYLNEKEKMEIRSEPSSEQTE